MKNHLLKKTLLRSCLPLALLGLALGQAKGEEFDPKAHYGESWTPDDLVGGKKKAPAAAASTPAVASPAPASEGPSPVAKGNGAEEGLRQWADTGYLDLSGRPLPVTGNWMCELPKPSKNPGDSPLGWDPNYFVELIKQGHHVIPTFIDTMFLTSRAFCLPEQEQPNVKKQVDELLEQWRPALEFCRDHKLPIAFRGWNYATYPLGLAQRRSQITKEPIKPEQDPRLLIDGKAPRENNPDMDPCGPIGLWKDFGTFWFNNPLMVEIQKIYPDPPLVIFLDNNEVGKVGKVDPKSDRFLAKYGAGPHDEEFLKKVAAEGYDERYQAMFDAARAACVSPTWSKNLRFVAYNSLKPPHDGGMPEFYDNDWQPAKTDFGAAGLQSDAMGMFVSQTKVVNENPSFLWSSIFWDGEWMGNIWRSRGQGKASPAKPFQYASAGQRWDFNRYEGDFQFGLWVMRPKLYFEFRGDPRRNTYMDGAWQRALAMVDRPWSNPVLRDFWRFGKLVPNRFAPPARRPWKWDQYTEEQKANYIKTDRWFLLACDANPPRGAWVPEAELHANAPAEPPPPYETGKDPWKDASLRVFSIALVRGEQPKRSWLIYAHAPLGAVSNAKVQLPGFGDVKLDSVPASGSFFLVTEADRSVKTLLAGGPAEIALSVKEKFVPSRGEVLVNAEVTCPPASPLTGFVWSWGDGKEIKQDKLQAVKIPFPKDGAYLVTVTGTTQSGEKVVGQQEVFVCKKPAKEALYDLPLNQMFDWKGPWAWTGQQGEILTTYSQLPNAGSKNRALVSGGKIVTDPERGDVLEFSGDIALNEGIWLAMDKDTVMDEKGVASRTISFRFKAASTQPRQILYADGTYVRGTNIYLLEGKLYAGSWAEEWPEGGSWITSGELQPEKWYQVTLVLDGATDKVENDKLSLYVDGVLVGKTAARKIPQSYIPPRLGGMTYGGKNSPITTFHDKKRESCEFKGCLSDFRFINQAIIPTASK
jgi:Concanavalin A-like lectin/glucanases superfamily